MADNKTAETKLPIRVLITGAAGQIGYSLIPLIANGTTFGRDQPVILHLLEIPRAEKALAGVVMEIEDGAYPLVKGIVATTETEVAFKDINVAVLVGGLPRKDGMTRRDLLSANAPAFVAQGKALNDFADPNVKVLVVANPANSNALVTMKHAPKIPRENFTCLTRLDQNRATFQVANKLGTETALVRNVVVWGNHSNTMFADVTFATAAEADKPSDRFSVKDRVDDAWVRGDFVKTVAERGAAVIAARGLSSAMSAANAIADHLRDWLVGTPEGVYASMGVATDGTVYGLAKDIIFSLPCTCSAGVIRVVSDLVLNDFQRSMLATTEKELLEERAALPE